MDGNRFTPFIVDDPGPKPRPFCDRRCLMLQIATAVCTLCWTLGIIFAVQLMRGDWHAASSQPAPLRIEAGR